MNQWYKVFETLQDAVIVIDQHWGVHYANEAAASLCEISARRFKGGKPFDQFLQLKGSILGEGETWPVDSATQYRELQFQTPSGRDGWVQASLQADPGAPRSYIVFLRDVSLEKSLHDKYKGELDQKEEVIRDLQNARAQLEDYSKNLEKKVEERTIDLQKANRLLAAVLDSLGQGILVFDKDGKCFPFYSKVATRLLETNDFSQPIATILKVPSADQAMFANWRAALFGEMLPFEDMAGLGPQAFTHSLGREISLSFNSMRDEQAALSGVVVVATDKTEEVRARQEAAQERAFAKRVVQIVTNRNQFRSFAVEAKRLLSELTTATIKSLSKDEVSRYLHTIKGGAASFSLNEVAQLAHEAENNWLSDTGESSDFTSAVLTLQNAFITFLNENLALFGGKLESGGRSVEMSVAFLYEWLAPQTSTERSKIHDDVIETYLKVSLREIFAPYNDTVVELAGQLEKKVKPLKFISDDVRILPEPYSEFLSTFVHVFRNATDHGLEIPSERLRLGKNESGEIKIAFSREAAKTSAGRDFLKIEIQDDGAGLDPERLKKKLMNSPELSFWASKKDAELIQVIFEPAFSTREKVTEISGRGIGLSALKSSAEALGGRVRVESTPLKGCRFIVEVPDFSFTEALDFSYRPALKTPA